MEWQLRTYAIKPGELDEWIDEWSAHVEPLRRRFGFRVVGPWVDGETFVWMLGYAGQDGFAAADARYSALLGIAGSRVSDGRHYFDCDGTLLVCFDPRTDGEDRDLKPNPAPVYLSVADVGAAFDRARGLAEVTDEIADRASGERSFSLRDPFGNELCVVQAGTEFAGDRFVG